MSTATETLRDAVTGYASAVRDDLTAAGIDLTPEYVIGEGDPPTVRIHTTRHLNDDPWRENAVIDWHGENGWSAGWFLPNIGGGTVRDQVWLGIGLVPPPKLVARMAGKWFSTPEMFAEASSAPSHESQVLDVLLADYSPGHADRPKPGPAEELNQLRAAMTTDGLDPAGHKRAAELLLATYGDEFTQHDLAAALVHATLTSGTDEAEHLRASLDDAWAELEEAREAITASEETVAGLRRGVRSERERGDRWVDRASSTTQAMRDLSEALRSEGLPGIARRIEDAMSGAVVDAAKRNATGDQAKTEPPAAQVGDTTEVEAR